MSGPVGSETPITQPYVIKGKATVTAQYPAEPHLDILLEPEATVTVQNAPGAIPLGYSRGAPVVLDGGKTVIRRK